MVVPLLTVRSTGQLWIPRHPRVLSVLLGSVVLTLGRVQIAQSGVQEVVGELVSSEGEGPVVPQQVPLVSIM